MSYNGTGTFLINTAGQPVVASTVISATTFNLLTADLANGLTNVITKDGQTTVTANIPMSNFKITGLGAATTANDAVRLEQLTSGATNVSFGNLAYTGTLTGGTGVVNLGSGQIYKDASGNVGIGTASPATYGKLAVVSAGADTRIAVVDDVTNGRGGYLRSNFSDAVILGTTSGVRALTFAPDNQERMRIDSSGNVGIGTSSPASKLEVTGDVQQTWAASMDRFVGSKFSTTYELGVHFLESSRETRLVSKAADSTGLISFYTGVTPTEKMRISAAGNVGIGVVPTYKFQVNPGDNQLAVFNEAGTWTANGGLVLADYYAATTLIGGIKISAGTATSGYLTFHTGGTTERARIDDSGNLLVSTSSAFLQLKSASTTFNISGQAGGNDFLRITANGTQRYQFNDVGQAYNTTGTWGTISDVRLKENIVDATSKLEGINQLRVVNFNLKSDPDVKQIGFIAQEVEQIFPGLVSDGEEDGEGGYYKSVKTTVLIPMLVKAIQEQQALIQDLTTRLNTLEGS
jgi:hypothetical protein